MRWLIGLTLYLLFPMQTVLGIEIGLSIGTTNIRATIANTTSSRRQGLMNTSELCSNCGMLFIFPQEAEYKFWMKNTPLPLSIAFIAADCSILKIDEMQPNTTTNHSTVGNYLYALEMNTEWFADHNIKPNECVLGLHLAPRAE